ncbi:MAG: hypothetical protein V7603_1710 [Micromonosporaceae bacterium]
MRARPVSPVRLVEELADTVTAAAGSGGRLRVAVDGAPAAEPQRLADALVDPVRLRGHAVLRVDTRDFLRPASVRLEQGRTNPDAFYEQWYDLGALSREVLAPLAPAGTGRVLPTFWDPRTDRATRASYVDLPAGGVLLLSGPLLLGAGLDLDLTIHCAVSPAALARRTPPGEQWTLPAFARYEEEVGPRYLADVVIRADDPRHPAVVL